MTALYPAHAAPRFPFRVRVRTRLAPLRAWLRSFRRGPYLEEIADLQAALTRSEESRQREVAHYSREVSLAVGRASQVETLSAQILDETYQSLGEAREALALVAGTVSATWKPITVERAARRILEGDSPARSVAAAALLEAAPALRDVDELVGELI